MFIAADVQKRTLKRQQAQLTFQQMIISNKRETNTAKMNGIQATCKSVKQKVDNWNNTQEDKRAALWKNDSWYRTHGNTTGSTGAIQNVESIANYDYTTNADYVALKALDDYLDTRNDNLESQLELINNQVQSYEKLVQNNISQDATLWCVGGGG